MFYPSSCPPVGVHTHLRLHQRWFRHSTGVSTRLLVDLLGFGERQTHGTLTYEPLHRPLAPFRTIVLWPWVVRNSSGAFSTTRHCHLQLCMATYNSAWPPHCFFFNHRCHGPCNHCRIVAETPPLPLPSTPVLLLLEKPVFAVESNRRTQHQQSKRGWSRSLTPPWQQRTLSNTGAHTLGA